MKHEVTKNELIIRASALLITVGIIAAKCCDGKVKKDNVSIRAKQTVEYSTDGEREFAPGEHLLSVTMDKPNVGVFKLTNTEDTIQIPNQDGYRVVGVSFEREKGCILYENTDYVYCVPSGISKDKQYVYTNFGRPQNIDKSYNENNGRKRFEKGEHVILKPISNPNGKDIQYDAQVDGYEVIGIDYAVYGTLSPSYAGGYIIYRNTVPVECTKKEKGYTSFGTPIKTKSLSMNN